LPLQVTSEVNSNLKNVFFWVVILVSAFLLWQSTKTAGKPSLAPEISYSEFLSQVEAGKVAKVTISGNQITGVFRDNTPFRSTGPNSQDGMLQALHKQNVEICFKGTAPAGWTNWLLNLAPLVLLAALWFMMIRRMNPRRAPSQSNGPIESVIPAA
jgi:cell division protease FtsH